MLNGVGIYREAVYLLVQEIAVFPSEYFSEAGPATRRGRHVAMGRAVGFWKLPTTSNAGDQAHFSTVVLYGITVSGSVESISV